MGAFSRLIQNGGKSAKIPNIIVLDNGGSVRVDSGVERKRMGRASIRKLPRSHAWAHSIDRCEKVF
jgi:hypothetical protein